ncbi:hypothetical protein ACTIVE_5069 [Actinomadura verrucosospora]|uniref:Uncharacterized protein n=1 Tax=Actinomadura verrucosospora TaxID=46165 RepID=A0A7D3ZYR1_ACTVE|nr:hypothetical protein ACTIVE_5069 [Actinomadura verrucosospora]
MLLRAGLFTCESGQRLRLRRVRRGYVSAARARLVCRTPERCRVGVVAQAVGRLTTENRGRRGGGLPVVLNDGQCVGSCRVGGTRRGPAFKVRAGPVRRTLGRCCARLFCFRARLFGWEGRQCLCARRVRGVWRGRFFSARAEFVRRTPGRCCAGLEVARRCVGRVGLSAGLLVFDGG